MPNREPIETTSLDTISGSPPIPWSRPLELLTAGPFGMRYDVRPRHREAGRPAARGHVRRRLPRRRPVLPDRARDAQGAQHRGEPRLHRRREPAGHRPRLRGRGPARRRRADARGGRRDLPRGRLARRGRRRRVHGARTRRRAVARRRGTSSASTPTPCSASPPPSRTARRAGASEADNDDRERRVAVAPAGGAAAGRRGVRVRQPALRPRAGVRAHHDAGAPHRRRRRRARRGRRGLQRRTAPRCTRPGPRCRSRASGRWAASASTSPR